VGTEPVEFCREIEAYLCRKNDGHLIRIAGPLFELVSSWAEQGVPLKVAFRGIDRYFERYYARGPRRRPVRIDFCEADVLEVFDEWRRATGVTARVGVTTDHDGSNEGVVDSAMRRSSLPAHMERALRKLTSARVSGTLDARFDELLEAVAKEFDLARRIRGEKRQALLDRLTELDRRLLAEARATLSDEAQREIAREAEGELSAFRQGMAADVFARAREAAIDRLVRERLDLPTIAFY
jgi:hypothetical protein